VRRTAGTQTALRAHDPVTNGCAKGRRCTEVVLSIHLLALLFLLRCLGQAQQCNGLHLLEFFVDCRRPLQVMCLLRVVYSTPMLPSGTLVFEGRERDNTLLFQCLQPLCCLLCFGFPIRPFPLKPFAERIGQFPATEPGKPSDQIDGGLVVFCGDTRPAEVGHGGGLSCSLYFPAWHVDRIERRGFG
jgi:hypothetical protein